MKTCSIDGCEKKHDSRGFCKVHAMRSRRSEIPAGTPLDQLRSPALEERFWAKVVKSEGCWNWAAAKVHNGYGVFTLPDQQQVAHKVAYRLCVGEVPEGYELDHACHNKSCVNPDHLRVVTRKQNIENRTKLQRNNTSGVQGVHWDPAVGKWSAVVKHFRKAYWVGHFSSLDDAAKAVLKKRNQLFTHNDLDRAA